MKFTLPRLFWGLLAGLRQLLLLSFLPCWLRRLILACTLACLLAYLSILITIGSYAKRLLKNPPAQKAEAALILGNRAYLHGRPNPCLVGRVNEGVTLAEQNLASTLVMSGGLDVEDGVIEAEAMVTFARNKGFNGTILLESRSSSTLENLIFSRPILKSLGVKNIIITSEPYHMWRVKKLVDAGHLGKDFNVSYAAAPSQCWVTWGMLFKGSLREPLAAINSYAKGYF